MADRQKTATVGDVATGANRAQGRAPDSADPKRSPDGSAEHVAEWSLDRLVDHIVQTHHRYVRSALPAIAEQLEALQRAHGHSRPALARVALAFGEMGRELERHLLKEEQILFPYVRQIAALGGHRRTGWTSPFGTVGNPIAMMEREHREAFDALRQIRELTHDYAVRAADSTEYSACMAALAEFEADLERHVHLENTVLFPRALALEKRMVEG